MCRGDAVAVARSQAGTSQIAEEETEGSLVLESGCPGSMVAQLPRREWSGEGTDGVPGQRLGWVKGSGAPQGAPWWVVPKPGEWL